VAFLCCCNYPFSRSAYGIAITLDYTNGVCEGVGYRLSVHNLERKNIECCICTLGFAEITTSKSFTADSTPADLNMNLKCHIKQLGTCKNIDVFKGVISVEQKLNFPR